MEAEKNEAEAAVPAAGGEAQPAKLKELEARLIQLLRSKYQLYWRRKETAAAPAGGDAGRIEELHRLQDEIKSVFDEIRLLDRKYIVPPFRMFE